MLWANTCTMEVAGSCNANNYFATRFCFFYQNYQLIFFRMPHIIATLYRHFCPEVDEQGDAFVSTVAMSALEYELSDEGILAASSKQMETIFRAKLLFEGKNPEEYTNLIHAAVEAGIALAGQMNQAYDTWRRMKWTK